MSSISKISQKKTGLMKCLDCTSEVYFCNQCTPKP
jgi:hypothetical protein